MPALSIKELVQATGGKLQRGDAATVVDSFGIDTRSLGAGSLFFALAGENTDGHRFLGDAHKRGVAAAVVERVDRLDEAPPVLIQVDDVARAMLDLGRLVRSQLKQARTIAVTGSNGKTSTKELIAAGLSATHRVHRTEGNFNNHLGLPLTLLACPGDAERLVLELAMSGPGEIAALTQVSDPDIGLVTNVRAVHLEFFNSLDDIAAAKGELFALMRDESTAVVNLDDAHVRVQATRHIGPRVTFGRHGSADLRLDEVHSCFTPGTQFSFWHGKETHKVQLRMGGAHAAFNALAALAVIVASGEPLAPAIEKMEQLESGKGRGRVHQLDQDVLLVDDSYNSSPAALASVLDTLSGSPVNGRKILVMGDMLELGRVAGALHREAGKRAATAGVQVLVTVGSLARQCAETARRSGVAEVYQHPDADKAAEFMTEIIREGDLVVVKGSRGVHLEKVVRALCAELKVGS